MTETQLTDLLQAAARASGGDQRPDPRQLIARARQGRRRQRVAGLCAAVAVVLVGAAVVPTLIDRGDGGVEVAAGEDKNDFKPGWTRLPDPPVSPRVDAVTTWTGREVVVVGGSNGACRDHRGACAELPLLDGAAFDLSARTWRSIAPPPRPISQQMGTVAVGGEVFFLTHCEGPSCAEPAALLRYRPLDDRWDVLPPPPADPRSLRLTGVGRSVVAHGAAPFSKGGQIWRFDEAAASWVPLPPNPALGDLREVVVLGDGDDVIALGYRPAPTNVVDGHDVEAARLARTSARWTPLPPSRGGPIQPQVLDGLVVVGQAASGSGGGILDLGSGTWRPLPARPAGAPALDLTDAGGQTMGALGRTTATFSRNVGWVLDTVSGAWVEVPPIDHRSASSLTSFGRRLFSFGGIRPPEDGDILNDAWVWTPPPPTAAAPATTAGPSTMPEAVNDPVSPDIRAGTVPTSAAPPATTPVPGAPRFVSATADTAAGRLTVRFDRPVTGDPVDKSPGSKTFAPDKTHPMNMIVFGSDAGCSSPQGNGQDYVSGLGTDTVTFEASSLAAGTTYVGIGQGVVKSVADGTFNSWVVVQGLPRAGFGGMSCIPVKATGSVPTTQPYVDPAGGPKLVSVTASAGGGGPGVPGGAGAGRVRLTFDKPVVPGDGPNFDGSSPNLQPPAGDNTMRAMQLVVHTTDSTCSSPNGNAHVYLAGVGTTTLTVDATSLVVGTTYISIAPGFAKAKADGKAMAWVRCMAIQVTA